MTSQATAEQFLAQQGIKFRVVASKRGPGEWNVTFSRKGGGRLKLDFYQAKEPTLRQVVEFLILAKPNPTEYEEDEAQTYVDDCKEYARSVAFFTEHEIQDLLHLQCELT
jgi:hypothetical protein